MSALLRIADSSRTSCEVRKVPIAEVGEPLFDHPVRPREKRGWKIEANCFRGFQADNQFKSARPLDRQVARARTPQNFVDRGRRIPTKVSILCSVTQQCRVL